MINLYYLEENMNKSLSNTSNILYIYRSTVNTFGVTFERVLQRYSTILKDFVRCAELLRCVSMLVVTHSIYASGSLCRAFYVLNAELKKYKTKTLQVNYKRPSIGRARCFQLYIIQVQKSQDIPIEYSKLFEYIPTF